MLTCWQCVTYAYRIYKLHNFVGILQYREIIVLTPKTIKKTFWKYELPNGIFFNRFLKAFFEKGNAFHINKYFEIPRWRNFCKIIHVFSGRVTSVDIHSNTSSASRLFVLWSFLHNERHSMKGLRAPKSTVCLSPYQLLRREIFIYFTPDIVDLKWQLQSWSLLKGPK